MSPRPAWLQLFLDTPAAELEPVVAFWSAVTGWVPSDRRGEDGGPVRAHPDLASADRAADTARHLALGASLVGVNDFWTVLTAPGGQVYCLTDRDPATGTVLPRV
jgi:hypothetical protein